MKLTLRVTENDIRLGKQGDANCCAIAGTVKRLVKPEFREEVSVSENIEVGLDLCAVKKGDISKFITKFDDNKAGVRPTDFVVDMPLELIDEKILTQVRF